MSSFPAVAGCFTAWRVLPARTYSTLTSAVSARRPSGPTSASGVQGFSPNASFAASPVFSLHPGPLFFLLFPRPVVAVLPSPVGTLYPAAARPALRMAVRGHRHVFFPLYLTDGACCGARCPGVCTDGRQGRGARLRSAHAQRATPPARRLGPVWYVCTLCLPRAGSGRAARAALGQRRAAAPLPSPDRWSPSVRCVPPLGVPCCGGFVDAIWWTSLHVADSAPLCCSACGTSRCPTVSADGLTADIFFSFVAALLFLPMGRPAGLVTGQPVAAPEDVCACDRSGCPQLTCSCFSL